MITGRKFHSLPSSTPRMSRTKSQPITNVGFRYPLRKKPELNDEDTASCLEVTSLSKHDQHSHVEDTQDSIRPFRCREVENEAERIMSEFLYDKAYDATDCKNLSQFLSVKIVEAIRNIGFSKYKMVAVVSIGSMKERPGMQFGSRCLWNKDTDNFISAKYNNASIFAVAMVYGLFCGP